MCPQLCSHKKKGPCVRNKRDVSRIHKATSENEEKTQPPKQKKISKYSVLTELGALPDFAIKHLFHLNPFTSRKDDRVVIAEV